MGNIAEYNSLKKTPHPLGLLDGFHPNSIVLLDEVPGCKLPYKAKAIHIDERSKSLNVCVLESKG